jgi:predicted nuclease of predicted toxin-antitoxin system
VDECIPGKVAATLRQYGFEAVHVFEVDRRGILDRPQLEYAAENGMALLTYNVQDFVPLHTEWITAGKRHCGILLAQDKVYKNNIGRLAKDVRSTLNSHGDIHGGVEHWIYNNILFVRP